MKDTFETNRPLSWNEMQHEKHRHLSRKKHHDDLHWYIPAELLFPEWKNREQDLNIIINNAPEYPECEYRYENETKQISGLDILFFNKKGLSIILGQSFNTQRDIERVLETVIYNIFGTHFFDEFLGQPITEKTLYNINIKAGRKTADYCRRIGLSYKGLLRHFLGTHFLGIK